MYEHCIYCSGKLGRNEALQGFPVGSSVAFDAERGRLWAVCPKCARWNLAPLEERWEVVEDAERCFRDTRIRAHSENVGLARLADGTRLIRIGAALPAEFAAWRYGRELARRRRKERWVEGTRMAANWMPLVGLLTGGVATIGLSLVSTPVDLYIRIRREWNRTEPILDVVPRPGLPDFTFRMAHFPSAVLRAAPEGGRLELHAHDGRVSRAMSLSGRRTVGRDVVLDDAATRRVLRRGMVYVNSPGASDPQISDAMRLLADGGGGEAFLHGAARSRKPLGALDAFAPQPGRATSPAALALEMAVHEEEERRILDGELTLLTSAWREAEQIARIADSLADPDAEPPS